MALRPHPPNSTPKPNERHRHGRLRFIADLLQIAAPAYTRNDQPTREDGSTNWHRNIASDDDLHDIRNLLVNATRNVAAQLTRRGIENTRAVIAVLQARPTVVFHRISLDIIRREKDAVPELVATALTNRTLFDDTSLQREYQQLLHNGFTLLQPHDQERIVTWIHDGPTNDQYQAASAC